MDFKCEGCKHWTTDDNRAHRDQCSKFENRPVWLAFQEDHLCKRGEHHEHREQKPV